MSWAMKDYLVLWYCACDSAMVEWSWLISKSFWVSIWTILEF